MGSTMEMTDASQNVVGTLSNDPYGDRPSASGYIPRLRYTGKLGAFRISEAGVGLDYMRGRWFGDAGQGVR
jgi:hypothetical protein